MSPWTKLLITVILLDLQIRGLQTQGTLTVITTGKYKCGSSVKLRCAPSGCCVGTINWNIDGNQIMTAGISTPTGKYTQTTVASSHFDFTIENLAITDFGGSYKCVFLGSSSNGVTLNATDFYCDPDSDPDCKICGLYCWLYNLIGVVLSIVVAVLIIHFCFDSLKECRTMVIISGTVVSLIVTAIVAPLIGVYACPCDYGNEPACIPIGFISGIIFGIVIVVNVNKGKDSTAEGSDNSTRPHHVEKKAEKKERAQNVTHLKTEGSSKLDDVPRGRPLPQLKDISHIPASVPPQNNTIKLDPIDVSAEKKKKKKKKKKQADGEENVGFDE